MGTAEGRRAERRAMVHGGQGQQRLEALAAVVLPVPADRIESGARVAGHRAVRSTQHPVGGDQVLHLKLLGGIPRSMRGVQPCLQGREVLFVLGTVALADDDFACEKTLLDGVAADAPLAFRRLRPGGLLGVGAVRVHLAFGYRTLSVAFTIIGWCH